MLKQLQTYPVPQDLILSLVTNWTTDQDITPPQDAESETNELIHTAYPGIACSRLETNDGLLV